MCGIAGIIAKRPGLDVAGHVEAMLDILAHRGPNQRGSTVNGNVGLGMVRLSIISSVEDEVPYYDRDRRACITYNGEAYNHEDVRVSLGSSCSYQTESDAETVLQNYLHKGVDSFQDYNGMYAFALYDVPEETLYLVRDKVGEKPLYYTETADCIAFASEAKALLRVREPVLNENCLSYRTYEFNVGEETLFKDIFSVLPGEYLRIKNGRITKHDYWKIWDNLIDIPDDPARVERDLTDLLVDAMELRTRNCVHQYAAFVSGGVDSSLVACITKPDHILHCHYPIGPDFDELEYAKLVAKKIGRELVLVEPTPEDYYQVREKLAYHLDTPCTWTSFSLWCLLERAKQMGVKVFLTGDGADETFGGYHRYHLLHNDEQIYKLQAMEQYTYLIQKYYGSPGTRYSRLVNRCEDPMDEGVNRYLQETIGFYFDKCDGDVIHAMGLHDFYTTMQVLLQMSDRVSMAFSVENRSPFLDYRLVQYVFSMSSSYKIREGTTKWILKRIARKFIPHEIADRVDKRGFSAPLNRWFGWDKHGQYDRSAYRNLAFKDWMEAFGVRR
ncbi:MAG: asparagine synthase (glutamine-hydrolyzing) [Desulfovibrionaceae bacterium]